jgi:hypothetical protein
MTWRDDIADCVIETAAGDRFVFEFRDLRTRLTRGILEAREGAFTRGSGEEVIRRVFATAQKSAS